MTTVLRPLKYLVRVILYKTLMCYIGVKYGLEVQLPHSSVCCPSCHESCCLKSTNVNFPKEAHILYSDTLLC